MTENELVALLVELFWLPADMKTGPSEQISLMVRRVESALKRMGKDPRKLDTIRWAREHGAMV